MPLGGLWASWGSPWRSLGCLGHHFGGPGALRGAFWSFQVTLGVILEEMCVFFVWIWQFSCINAVLFKKHSMEKWKSTQEGKKERKEGKKEGKKRRGKRKEHMDMKKQEEKTRENRK